MKKKREDFSKTFFLYAISLAILIAGLSMGYYFIYALPKIQRDKQNLESQKFELQKQEQNKEAQKENYYKICADEAESKAKETAQKKVEIMEKQGGSTYQFYKAAADKGMYLKDDYNDYYNNCLRSYGLE